MRTISYNNVSVVNSFKNEFRFLLIKLQPQSVGVIVIRIH